jgi:hypothetical protein
MGEIETFSVPSAEISLNLFPGSGFQALQVGVLPDSINPMGINVLGSDF